MKKYQTKAFTLVELIIVITILAILATIGFMSFQSYTLDSRDVNRTTSLKTISNGLQIYEAKNSILPIPDEQTVNIMSGTSLISIQGYAGTSVLQKLKASDIKDPSDNSYYTYIVNSDKTKYQLLSMLEKDVNLVAYSPRLGGDKGRKECLHDYSEVGAKQRLGVRFLNEAYARTDYTSRYAYTIGNKVGVFFSGTTNIPLQESTGGILNLALNTTKYKVIFSNSLNASGTITATGSSLPDIIKLETNSVEITQTYSCTTKPNYINASFVEGTPTGVNQIRQNTNSNTACYYTCTNGYTGVDCNSKLNILDFFGDNSGKALYRFENNANDTSGNYNGTASNITYSSGKFGTGASFNGTSSYIATLFTIPAIQNYTFSTWIKTANTSSNMSILRDFNNLGQNASGRGILGFFGTKFTFNMGNNSSSWYDETTYSSSSVRDNNWHNVIIVINGTSQKVYIDGALFRSLTSSVNSGTIGARNYIIGRGGDYNGIYYNGMLDQIRIFTKSLSQAEVTQLYNEQ